MNLKVIQEDHEILPIKSCWELLNKLNKFLCLDWLWMQGISLKASVLTDGRNERHSYDFDCLLLHFDASIFFDHGIFL